MGLSSSKLVAGKLQTSPEFTSACNTVYQQSLSLTQHVFPGIPRYQIASASNRLYQTLSDLHLPLINKWVTSAPTRSQIDKSLQKTLLDDNGDPIVTLGDSEFRDFAVDLYTDVIVSNANKEVLFKVPIGVAGILGVGVVARMGVGVVGTVVGAYAVGVATSVYLSFGGGSKGAVVDSKEALGSKDGYDELELEVENTVHVGELLGIEMDGFQDQIREMIMDEGVNRNLQ